jgi:hypothetical protein
LYTETTPGVFPFYRAIDTSNLAGAAFQTTGKFDHHLLLFVKGVKVGGTGINTETFFAGVADFLVKSDMGLFVIFKGVEG